jgi:hypothetical protein
VGKYDYFLPDVLIDKPTCKRVVSICGEKGQSHIGMLTLKSDTPAMLFYHGMFAYRFVGVCHASQEERQYLRDL